jgi:hypothetical protein
MGTAILTFVAALIGSILGAFGTVLAAKHAGGSPVKVESSKRYAAFQMRKRELYAAALE